MGLHPGVEHEEEDPDLGQERDRLTGLHQAEDSRSHRGTPTMSSPMIVGSPSGRRVTATS